MRLECWFCFLGCLRLPGSWVDGDALETQATKEGIFLMKRSPKTIQEIRERCQVSYYHDFHMRMSRMFSPYLTFFFIKLGFNANGVTYLSMVVGLAGAFVLLLKPSVWWFASPIFLALASLMDHCDGEVARWRGEASLTGLFVDRLYPIIVHPITFGVILIRLYLDNPSVLYFIIGLAIMWLANMPRIIKAYIYLCFSDGLLKPQNTDAEGNLSRKLEVQSGQMHTSEGSSESLLKRFTYPFVFLLTKGTGIALSILILVIMEQASVTILEISPFAVYVIGYIFVLLGASLKYAVSVVRNRQPDLIYKRFRG